MVRVGLTTQALAVLALLGSAGVASGADAGRTWGTVGTPGSAFLNSSLAHQADSNTAAAVEFGRDGGNFRNVTSCGTCTTITIQGNQNSVSGNSITSTNFGTVSSTGIFNFDGF